MWHRNCLLGNDRANMHQLCHLEICEKKGSKMKQIICRDTFESFTLKWEKAGYSPTWKDLPENTGWKVEHLFPVRNAPPYWVFEGNKSLLLQTAPISNSFVAAWRIFGLLPFEKITIEFQWMADDAFKNDVRSFGLSIWFIKNKKLGKIEVIWLAKEKAWFIHTPKGLEKILNQNMYNSIYATWHKLTLVFNLKFMRYEKFISDDKDVELNQSFWIEDYSQEMETFVPHIVLSTNKDKKVKATIDNFEISTEV